MVQVLPETSNQNIWGQALSQAIEGYNEYKAEDTKQKLFSAATDSKKTPIQQSEAMEQYIGKYGKIEDILKFRKEQGRIQAMNNLQSLLFGDQQQMTEGTGPPGQNGVNLQNIAAPVNTQNANPMIGPVSDQQFQQLNPLQQFMQPNQQQQKADPEKLEQALFNLAQVDPTLAKNVSDIIGRQQKDKIAQENSDLKQQTLNLKREKQIQDDEHFRQSKILPIQADAMTTIKDTNNVLKATNDQLAAVQADATGTWSMANLSQLLRDAGHTTLANSVQSSGGAAMITAGKEIFTGGFKRAFGARPIGIEFEAFDAMLPEIGRKKEVNELVIKSIQAEYKIANEVAKYKMQLLTENPQISPIELNNKAYKFEEEATDRVFDEWAEYRDKALESMKQKSSWFSKQIPTYDKATEAKKSESKPESWQDLWK